MSLPLTANVASRLREGDYRIFFEIPIVRIDALHELDPPEVADGFRLKYTAVLQDGSNGDAVPIVLPEDALRQAYCNDCNFDSCAIGNGTIVMVHFMLRIPSRREILVYVAEALCPHASQQTLPQQLESAEELRKKAKVKLTETLNRLTEAIRPHVDDNQRNAELVKEYMLYKENLGDIVVSESQTGS